MLKESCVHFRFMVTFLKNKGDKKADSLTCIGKRRDFICEKPLGAGLQEKDS